MAGNVVISPNIKKTSVRLDAQGNIIDPKTKEIIERPDQEYVPTQAEIAKSNAPQVPVTNEKPKEVLDITSKINSKIEEIINKKIEELVAKKVEEALKNL